MWLIIMLCFGSSAIAITYTVHKNIKLNQKEAALNSESNRLSDLKSQLQNERKQFATKVIENVNELDKRRRLRLKNKENELKKEVCELAENKNLLEVEQKQLEAAKTNQSIMIEIKANELNEQKNQALKYKEIELDTKERKLSMLVVSHEEQQKKLINFNEKLKNRDTELDIREYKLNEQNNCTIS